MKHLSYSDKTLDTSLGPIGRVCVFNGFYFIDNRWFIKLDDSIYDVSLFDARHRIADKDSGAPINIGSTNTTTQEGNAMIYGWFDKCIGLNARIVKGGIPHYDEDSINLIILQ